LNTEKNGNLGPVHSLSPVPVKLVETMKCNGGRYTEIWEQNLLKRGLPISLSDGIGRMRSKGGGCYPATSNGEYLRGSLYMLYIVPRERGRTKGVEKTAKKREFPRAANCFKWLSGTEVRRRTLVSKARSCSI